MNGSNPLILAVEDDENDQIMLRLAVARAKLTNPVVVVSDGREAVDYLTGSPPYRDRTSHPLPSLLLLDLNMPRMDGFEVLGWLGGRRYFKNLPVVAFSASTDPACALRARQMGAREFLVKPHALWAWAEILKALHIRWLAPGNSRSVHSFSESADALATEW